MRIIETKNIDNNQLRKILTKPAFDEVMLGEYVKKRIKESFGKELSAVEVVETIVNDIRSNGDNAVKKYIKLIDNVDFANTSLEVTTAEYEKALSLVDSKVVAAIKKAVSNVKKYHEEQKPKSWITYRDHGSILGQSCIPLEIVGIYVPGGTASYPSSVIMNAVPAAVAGVKDIIMVVPSDKNGEVNPYVLVAAKEAGVSRIFKVGGAQGIAALAFATETIPKVDKITGPGNIFVTLAKKAVYGHCDIDMLAGPSEILIVADQTADPAYIAADMLSQAEHDVLASSILLTDNIKLAQKVTAELEVQLAKLPRAEIAKLALEKNGLIIVADNIKECMELANVSAPEHLEILTADPFNLLPLVRHAGAVFLGAYSPEPLGDYFAGPNHVLPTGGTARFYSVLNVETFMKRTSIISYTKEALQAVQDDIISLAEAEGLTAHANAIRVRGE